MDSLPDDIDDTIALVNIGMAVLVAALAYPMLRGMVSRNRLYGFRTRKSLSSDQEWYTANKLGGRCMIIGAAGILAFNLAVLGFGPALPSAVTTQLLLYSTPAALVASALVALLLHQRA